MQSVRRLANCLRSFAGYKANINIVGNFQLYPWAFRHASFLINRFRVLERTGKTSYELATGHGYRGKLALFGDSVTLKRVVRNKGSDGFIRGIWCGKHVPFSHLMGLMRRGQSVDWRQSNHSMRWKW